MISSSLILEMGSCSSSIYLPSVRTAVNKALFWISVKLHWKEIEISDHKRSIVKTTVTWDRQKTPAVSLRQRVRSRMNDDPNTIGIIWTSSGEMTTAITITMEHIQKKMTKRNSQGSRADTIDKNLFAINDTLILPNNT